MSSSEDDLSGSDVDEPLSDAPDLQDAADADLPTKKKQKKLKTQPAAASAEPEDAAEGQADAATDAPAPKKKKASKGKEAAAERLAVLKAKSKSKHEVKSFGELALDDRLLKAVAALGWRAPTLIQVHAIREALTGKDVLARARTGSGKTGAYALAVLNQILKKKQGGDGESEPQTRALIIVPTKELARQAARNINELAQFCAEDVSVIDVASAEHLKDSKMLLAEKPDIVVGTPTRVLAHVKAKHLDLSSSLTQLIIDEADLVFSYGYEDDLKELLAKLPKIYQTMLMSATLGSEVEALKKLVLRRPVILKLENTDLPDEGQLTQYTVTCPESDKFMLMYALLKLRLLRGKTIIFSNNIEQCYRVKLFLEHFSIAATVLNSQLPIQSRQHIVEQFNKGVYDYVIASDEAVKKSLPLKNKHGKRKRYDAEYGVSRGVDFKGVKNVLNFDFPATPHSYVHRVGRTARGHNAGVALSLVSTDKDKKLLTKTQNTLKDQPDDPDPLKPYDFKMAAISGLRVRCREAMKTLTKRNIREARRKEIRQEVLNSEKLKTFFAENPKDAEVLRHDAALLPAKKIKAHLKHLPDYLLPKGVQVATKKRKDSSKFYNTKKTKAKQKKQNDPLKSFGFRKKPA